MSGQVEPTPSEVLALLNELGLRRVSALQLKYFVNDLKKLIRHDQRSTQEQVEEIEKEPQKPVEKVTIAKKLEVTDRLYAKETVSSRSKRVTYKEPRYKVDAEIKCPAREAARIKQREIKSAGDKPRKMKTSANFIKVPLHENKKKSDPVSLYHYYASMWDKYKDNLPGENNWSDLRWSIREKLLGEKETQAIEPTEPTEEELARRREGWINPSSINYKV